MHILKQWFKSINFSEYTVTKIDENESNSLRRISSQYEYTVARTGT